MKRTLDPCGYAALDQYEAVFPIPDQTLNPNWREHWTTSAPARQTARLIARNAALSAYATANIPVPGWGSVAVATVINWGTDRDVNGYWDTDNFSAALKPYLDGFVDAGIILDDRVVWDWRVTAYLVEGLSGFVITIRPERPHHTWLVERLAKRLKDDEPAQAKFTYPKGHRPQVQPLKRKTVKR